jgi:hypothetical protein
MNYIIFLDFRFTKKTKSLSSWSSFSNQVFFFIHSFHFQSSVEIYAIVGECSVFNFNANSVENNVGWPTQSGQNAGKLDLVGRAIVHRH